MAKNKDLKDMSLEELWELFPIILKKHNPDYKKWYLEEKENLIYNLDKDKIERINHIGSTAVEGLIAKPTVDILLEIVESYDLEKLKSSLEANGWILMHENDSKELNLVFNKGYTPEGFADKVFHPHIRYLGDWDELYFRDYLKKDVYVAQQYAELKLSLEKRYKLNPEVVDCLVFVTKNPAPMLARNDEISDFNQYWQVTITPYGKGNR